MAPWTRSRARYEFALKNVFVGRPGVFPQPLEMMERARQELRLHDESFGAAVIRRARLEHTERQPLEGIDVPAVTMDRIVEIENFGDKSRPKTKWRKNALLLGAPAGDAHQHFALGFGERDSGHGQSCREGRVKRPSRHEVRQHERVSRGGASSLYRSHEVRARSLCRDGHQAISCVEGSARTRQICRRLAECVEIRHPHEPRRASSNWDLRFVIWDL
jgi:hypothetical protein